MLPTDIDSLTDEQLDQLIESQELKCKIDPKTGDVKCATSEDLSRAIARLKNQPRRIVFEVTSEPAPAAPDTRLNPTES